MPKKNINASDGSGQRCEVRWSKPYKDPQGFLQPGYVQIVAPEGVVMDEVQCHRLSFALLIARQGAYPKTRSSRP